MDPSFKQYTYTEGMHLGDAVPFDAEGFAEHIEDNSTINEDEGWVQGVDQDYIEAQLADYQSQVGDYVDNQNPGATVGDVLGDKTIAQEHLPLLAASLPYHVVSTASRMAVLPDNVRWKFSYKLDGQTMISKSLPSLAGHFMALSFTPATADDEATLESYIPDNITDASDLPDSLPAGVVSLTSEFSIDGETVATGPGYRLGDEVMVKMALYQPHAGWQESTSPFTAGGYQAVGAVGVGVSKAKAEQLQAQLEASQAALEAQDSATLNKHDLTGALMQTSLMNYFAQISAKAEMTARSSKVVHYSMPSYGTISTRSNVALLYGMIPTSMTPTGVVTDMDHLSSIAVSKTNDSEVWTTFNKSIGSMLSRAESGVLEEQYSTPTQQLHGITAVQALATASAQGQRIYTINADNAAAAMSQLNLQPFVMTEIANAINAGFVVTTSQSSIDYQGQTTAGYIIMDPSTGAAAYKIASGADGGVIALGAALGALLFLAAVLIVLSFLLASIVGLLVGIFAVGIVLSSLIYAYQNYDNNSFGCLVTGFLVTSLIGLPVIFGGEVFAAVLSIITGLGSPFLIQCDVP